MQQLHISFRIYHSSVFGVGTLLRLVVFTLLYLLLFSRGLYSSMTPSSPASAQLMSLQSEASRLQRDNAVLNEQLELVMVQVELVQQRNAAMKTLLLEVWRGRGGGLNKRRINEA